MRNQEEPRTYCTSIGSDTSFKDFILVPNSSEGSVGQHVEVCESPKNISPETITVPLPNWSYWIMFQAA